MKKYIVLLAGLMMSLATLQAAQNIPPVKNWYPNAELDPYSCTATYELSSTYYSREGIPMVRFYQDNGALANPRYTWLNDEPGQTRVNSFVVEMSAVGEYTYVVVAGQSGNSSYQTPDMPNPSDMYIYQYDVYHITVTGPTIPQGGYSPDDPLMADPITGEAEFTISSSMGKTDGQGNAYCSPATGARYVEIYVGDGAAPITGTPEDVMPGGSRTVNLGEGYHPIQVQMYDKPGGILLWEDQYDVNVAKAACRQDLVYSKWDDFMFVNNGKYGGKGTFVAYQWYKDGEPVPGATEQWYRTILYEQESETATGSAPEYAVKIWKNDNTVIYVCPFTWSSLLPSKDGEPYQAPSRKQIINSQLTIERDGLYYNAQGQRVQ